MKKNLVWVLGISAAVLFTSCKSRESAYRQAYEQAMAQDNNKQNEQETVVSSGSQQETVLSPRPLLLPWLRQLRRYRKITAMYVRL